MQCKMCWSFFVQSILPTCQYQFPIVLPIAEKLVPKILMEVCAGPMTPTQHLENQQALVKQFAEILEFTLKFDEYKVCLVMTLLH